MSRNGARDLVDRAAVDIFQPEPVICGGISETLFIAELARLNAISAVPHTSGSALGIASAVQAMAALADPTRLPLHDLPLLEVGTDPTRGERTCSRRRSGCATAGSTSRPGRAWA